MARSVALRMLCRDKEGQVGVRESQGGVISCSLGCVSGAVIHH